LIHLGIIAQDLAAGRQLAEALAEDSRFEVIDITGFGGAFVQGAAAVTDCLIVLGIAADQIPPEGPPVVLVSDETGEDGGFEPPIRAVLPTDASVAEIAAAVEAAAHEFVVLTQTQAQQWLHWPRRVPVNPPVEALTARERQVLRMMADGLGNKEIAGRLEISSNTAKFHVAQILAKLAAGSRAEAVAIGIRRGLVPI
jgi:DNA-binding NarL/FixJ family response regulator